MGNGETRKIASGLQGYVTLEDLKEKKLGGYPSHGMILCASTPDEKVIEPLIPPEGSIPGDKIVFDGYEMKPVADINISKKNNPWTKVQPELTTDSSLIVNYQGRQLKTDKGAIRSKTIASAQIS